MDTQDATHTEAAPEHTHIFKHPCTFKVVTNQSGVVFSLSKGEKWSVWMRMERGFNHEHLRGQRVQCGEASILFFSFLCCSPTSLPPTHPFISPLLALSVPSLFPPPPFAADSTLSSNTPTSPIHALRAAPHFYTPWPGLAPPFHLSESSFLHPGFYQAPTYFNFCLHLSTLLSLHHSSLTSALLLSSLSYHPSFHFSIPQLPALRTSGIVNLV